MASRAFPAATVLNCYDDHFQQQLARWNRERLAPQFPSESWREDILIDEAMLRFERAFLDELRAEVGQAITQVPTDPTGFVEWFESLKDWGPGQGDPLFPWLAEQASLDEIKWFLEQEAAGEAGFDDLVAMTQIKLPSRAKLELARNYWDEMGRGNAKGMHGPILSRLITALDLKPEIETTVWQSLALANSLTAMASSRSFAWHSVGALGVIELTAPYRSACVAQGLRRLGVSQSNRLYFDLHATLDIKHSEAWNLEAILPLVEEDPRRAKAIAEGALMRLTCGARCFQQYRKKLWRDEIRPADGEQGYSQVEAVWS